MTTIFPQTTEHPLQLYRIELTPHRTGKRKQEPEAGTRGKKEIPLICSRCSTPITSREQAVQVQGRHEHAFFNPAGTAFEIRCFRQAPGCLVQGSLTEHFSWFEGYSWQFATCSNCLTQLGWFFISDIHKNSFFGLMIDKVI